MIDIAKVKSVYSGIDGKCCCGCAGKHSTSERSIKIIVNRMNKLAKINRTLMNKHGDHHAWLVNGKRLYVAYFHENQEYVK